MTIRLDNLGVLVGNKRAKAKACNPTRKLQGVELLAAVAHVTKLLASVQAELDASVRQSAMAAFIANGCEQRQHPGNWTAQENGSTVSIELRKLGTAMSDEAVALAEAHELPVEVAVETHDTYAINPIYARDEKMMKCVVAALNRAKLPDDILKVQHGVTQTRTTKTTLDEVFKLPRRVAEVIVGTFSTLVITRLKYAGTDQEALDAVASLGVELDLAA